MSNSKRLVSVLVGVGLSLAPVVAMAADDIPQGNGNPTLVQQSWGLTMEQSQHYIFASGTNITLKNGSVFTCPFWYPAGCVDLRWFYGV